MTASGSTSTTSASWRPHPHLPSEPASHRASTEQAPSKHRASTEQAPSNSTRRPSLGETPRRGFSTHYGAARSLPRCGPVRPPPSPSHRPNHRPRKSADTVRGGEDDAEDGDEGLVMS